jgi:hypothetical protein
MPMPAFAPVDRPELTVLWIGEDTDYEVEERLDWTIFELEIEVEEGVAVEEEARVEKKSTSEVLVGSEVEMTALAELSVKTSVFCEMWNRPMPESQQKLLLFVTFWQLIRLVPHVFASV